MTHRCGASRVKTDNVTYPDPPGQDSDSAVRRGHDKHPDPSGVSHGICSPPTAADSAGGGHNTVRSACLSWGYSRKIGCRFAPHGTRRGLFRMESLARRTCGRGTRTHNGLKRHSDARSPRPRSGHRGLWNRGNENPLTRLYLGVSCEHRTGRLHTNELRRRRSLTAAASECRERR